MDFIKKNMRMVIAVGIALILIIAGVILILIDKDNGQNDSSLDQKQKEEQIVEVTGMRGEDAIEIVKANFNTNNYEFSSEVTSDSLYKVIAVNKADNSEIIYFVDPVNGRTYVSIDTE